MQFPHVCPPCDLPLMLYVSNAWNEVLCVEFKEATIQGFLRLKVKDIIAEYRASQKWGHHSAGWRFSSYAIVHRPLCSFEEDPQHFFISKAEVLPRHSVPHSHITCELLLQFPLWKCCSYYRISLSLPLFEEKPLLIRLPSRSSCHFLFLSCLFQSFIQLLYFFFLFFPQSQLCQPRLSLVFHFPICLLSAIGPPLTCGSLFPCSPCVLLAWVWLFTLPKSDLAAWLIALVWSTAVNLILFPDWSQYSFLCFQVLL